MLQTGLCSNLDLDQDVTSTLQALGIASPFTREFYSPLENIKIIKRDRFETNTESIIDINPSFTVYPGTYKGQPIIVREIFEKYTNVRQCLAFSEELKTFNSNFAKEHDSFMDLLAVALSDGKLFMLFHN